jgi:putative membrane protein
MAWIKSFHIAFLLIWCAGLLYMPGLFSSYAHAHDRSARRHMRMITRYVFIVVASPAAILAVITGSLLAYLAPIEGTWLPAKLLVVSGLVFFHLYCGARVVQLEKGEEVHRRQFHITLVAIPLALIGVILWLVLAKPDLLGWLT